MKARAEFFKGDKLITYLDKALEAYTVSISYGKPQRNSIRTSYSRKTVDILASTLHKRMGTVSLLQLHCPCDKYGRAKRLTTVIRV